MLVGVVGSVNYQFSVAAVTEDCIFNEFKNTEAKYKHRIRSRVANLKVSQLTVVGLYCNVVELFWWD